MAIIALSSKAQTYQGFEGTSNDNWNFTADPARYIYAGSEDYWGDTTLVGDNADSISLLVGNKMWTVWDIENNYTSSPHVHTLAFDPINIANFAINELSFQYSSFAFDGSDSLGYIVAYDNGNTWDYNDYVALDKSTGAWTKITVTAPANSQYIRVLFYFRQNGGGDWAALDDINLYSANSDVLAPEVSLTPMQGDFDVPINTIPQITFNEDVRLMNNTAIDNSNVDALVELRLNDSLGTAVAFDATFANNTITVTPSQNLMNNQDYYLALKKNTVEDLSDNAVALTSSSIFKTIVQQTQFNPGDLVPVAYRMNATGTEDEIALLTLVNILPGTFIHLADAKYTDNTQAQCDGGLLWEAPAGGVAAGTVIQIQTSAEVASVGNISGSGFGLSSGGDQVIVYTGDASVAHHITALSSNMWLTNNTSCSGSESKIPASLTDGTSAINLSTAPGNTAGNSPNAYYAGTMVGSLVQLRASILDAANWVAVASGTAPQTWPTWSFAGPPSVVSAATTSQTSIQVVFNHDMNLASATNLANYSGIAGLTAVTMTNNGPLADTVTLTFNSPFGVNQAYSLMVSNVMDADMVALAASYNYNFTYSSIIAFDEEVLIIAEDGGQVTINMTITNPSSATANLVLKSAPWSTANSADITFSTQVVTANATSLAITIPIMDDGLVEQDEYFVLALENASGLQIDGAAFITVYIKDNDRKAPVASQEIKLTALPSFSPGGAGNATTEIVVYDAGTKRLFATSAIENRFDIIDFSNPASPSVIKSVDMTPYGGITSIAVNNGVLAVASPNANEQVNGTVVIFNTNGDFQKQVTVGALPDMITFTHNGQMILTANEGQPNEPYTVDPEGSVSLIDISGGIAGLTQANVTTLDFKAFNGQEAALIASGVRKTWAAGTLSQDLEPEYITINKASTKAWVTLQENNAMAEIDLTTKTVTSIWAFGTKDMSAFGNGFDASDKSDEPLIANWNVKAFFMPDAVASYETKGKTYLVTANEGDEKEYGPLNERATVKSVVLNPSIYPNAEMLQQDHNLGRLRITNLNGVNSKGEYEQLHVVGPRSFSIWDADSKSLVFESGDIIELITSQDPVFKALFNADNEDNELKGRSRSKGPEPEGVAVAQIGDEFFAFIGLERVGGVMVFNITDPSSPVFVDYKNNRDVNTFGGDNGPEGITYIAPQVSPDGKAYVIIANEISGSLSIFEIENVPMVQEVGFLGGAGFVTQETASPTQITIDLNAPAEVASSIVLRVKNGQGAMYGSDYTTSPSVIGDSIVLQVAKGASAVSFTFTPVNDAQFESNEQVSFEIVHVSEWLKVGSKASYHVTIESEDPNGVELINGREKLQVYPNPVNGNDQQLNFNKSVSVFVYDMQGRKVMEMANTTQINLSDLSRGAYMIRTTEGESISFVIE